MTNQKHNITILHQRFARALFDNVAEMPRELTFKKGDILTVLQEKCENNSEWWVCSLRNMVGFAPANRLEAMPILIEATPQFKTQMSNSVYDEFPDAPVSPNTYSNIPNLNIENGKKEDFYSVYQMPNEEIYTNNIPTRRVLSSNVNDSNSYKLPRRDILRSSNTYFNVPEPLETSPYSRNGSDNRPLSLQNIKSNEYYNNRYDYSDSFSDATSTSLTDTFGSSLNSFIQLSINSSESGDLKSLPTALSAPLRMPQEEIISKYKHFQTELTSSSNKVIEFVKAKWKSEEMLKLTIKSIKLCFLEFYQNLQNLTNFSLCILENSKTCGDINLTKKIWKHLQPLQEAILTIKESIEKMERMNWSPDKIAVSVRLAYREGADCLSEVISSSRNVLIHIRSLSVTIIGNANVLFPEISPETPCTPEDNSSILPQNSKEGNTDKANLKEMMRLFGQQMKSQTEHVNETVNDFIKLLSTIPKFIPPKDQVISHSKFVVRSATQLVCIAKSLTDAQIKTIPNQKIEQEGNNLCNSLKMMVNTTKEILVCPENSNRRLEGLIELLKTVKANANNLQNIVVDSVAS